MSCETIDLKEYFFGEAPHEQRKLVEGHLQTCPGCREELSRLQMTQAALGALRDEELPRRIAFVSDKVFEPRWYQRVWRSGPQLGFISAAMLTAALLVNAFVRPAPVATTAQVAIDPAVIEREVAKRVDAAVTKAVADSDARQRQNTAAILAAAEKKYELDRKATIEAINAQAQFIHKAMNHDYAANNLVGSGQ